MAEVEELSTKIEEVAMEGELLGCPFCGEQPVIEDDGDRVIIKCVADVCGVEPHTFSLPDLEQAKEEWNTRAPVEVTPKPFTRA